MSDKTKDKEFGIHFGVLADPLSKQLESQGMKYNPPDVEQFQSDLDAIHRLRIRSLLIDSVARKCFDKLYKKVLSHVLKSNRLKEIKP